MILNVFPLRFPFQTQSPFLFAVHHLDKYPAGSPSHIGINAPLNTHNLGMDFNHPDGWSMYHGRKVPGFPGHPHKGFETVTFVRQGVVDHHDSLGSCGRFSDGDVQWMTAGRDVQHSEMFPQIHTDKPNTLDLFQIWLNLPKAAKNAPPHYSMHWAERAAVHRVFAADGSKTPSVTIHTVAGTLPLDGAPQPPSPPPSSWAADRSNNVAIWAITVAPGASWELPAADAVDASQLNRSLFFFQGAGPLRVGDVEVKHHANMHLDASLKTPITNLGQDPVELLMLQGKPIDEPVVQRGPFVMNSNDEIRQAMTDFHAGKFGEWDWPEPGPVLSRETPRFARFPDGSEEYPEKVKP